MPQGAISFRPVLSNLKEGEAPSETSKPATTSQQNFLGTSVDLCGSSGHSGEPAFDIKDLV